MSTIDPMETAEFAVESRVAGLVTVVDDLTELRLNNEAHRSLIDNAGDIEIARDKLSRILDDVRGVS